MSFVHEGYNADIQSQKANYEWRKSSWSMNGGHCVEVASTRRHILVRDSTAAAGPRLLLSAEAWGLLIKQIKGLPIGLRTNSVKP
jgi:Domain of unknown function (DUF397)